MLEKLSEPFPPEDVQWRAQNIKRDGTSALALAYIDARMVMDRLDEVMGPANWQDRYEFHGTRTICYLSLRVDGEWITKADGAGDSDVEAEKGAISDALKRSAVKWGIGRYLYDIESPWVPCEAYENEYNGKKKWVWRRWKDDPWNFVRQPKAPTPSKQPEPKHERKPGPRLTEAADIEAVFEALVENLKRQKTKMGAAAWAEMQAKQLDSLPDNEFYSFRKLYGETVAKLPADTRAAG